MDIKSYAPAKICRRCLWVKEEIYEYGDLFFRCEHPRNIEKNRAIEPDYCCSNFSPEIEDVEFFFDQKAHENRKTVEVKMAEIAQAHKW